MKRQIADEWDEFEKLKESVSKRVCNVCFEAREDGLVIKPSTG